MRALMKRIVHDPMHSVALFVLVFAIATGAYGAGGSATDTDSQSSKARTSRVAGMSVPEGSSSTARAVFVKYDGIDGESKDSNHDKWIDVLSVDWGAQRPGAGATGQSRRRGSAVVEDLVLTIDYEKASPKLMEKCLKGEVIPKLEIELTSSYGGARETYLKYELKNVMITSYRVSSGSGSEGPPTVVIGNNFEEIKVTYTEYDDMGSSKGNVETTWKVEKGEK